MEKIIKVELTLQELSDLREWSDKIEKVYNEEIEKREDEIVKKILEDLNYETYDLLGEYLKATDSYFDFSELLSKFRDAVLHKKL